MEAIKKLNSTTELITPIVKRSADKLLTNTVMSWIGSFLPRILLGPMNMVVGHIVGKITSKVIEEARIEITETMNRRKYEAKALSLVENTDKLLKAKTIEDKNKHKEKVKASLRSLVQY